MAKYMRLPGDQVLVASRMVSAGRTVLWMSRSCRLSPRWRSVNDLHRFVVPNAQHHRGAGRTNDPLARRSLVMSPRSRLGKDPRAGEGSRSYGGRALRLC
jgi:hypothetical protein